MKITTRQFHSWFRPLTLRGNAWFVMDSCPTTNSTNIALVSAHSVGSAVLATRDAETAVGQWKSGECFTKNFLLSSHTQKIWLYLIRIIRTYLLQSLFTVTSLFCNVNIHADLCTIVSNIPHAKQPYAYRRCSNYIFILDWTSDFNRLRKDTYKTKQETFKFWNLLRRLY